MDTVMSNRTNIVFCHSICQSSVTRNSGGMWQKSFVFCFLGREWERVLHVENTWKPVENPWICRHFSLVGQGKTRKTREKRGLNEWTEMYVFGLG